jgi:3-methylcrotonyl-CoA carboxylase alpha subunit/acetyl-CoA/propionyl-CoA carboxylase biotin carboxyl carrier protein
VLVELDRLVSVAAAAVDGTPVVGLEHADGPDGTFAVTLVLDGRREVAVGIVGAHGVEVVHRGQRFVFQRPDAFADHAVHAGDGTLLAPMPGTVLAVQVAAGDRVAEGQTLGMMEAMKMELALRAPFAGTMTAVDATAGSRVALGARLFVVEPDGDLS